MLKASIVFENKYEQMSFVFIIIIIIPFWPGSILYNEKALDVWMGLIGVNNGIKFVGRVDGLFPRPRNMRAARGTYCRPTGSLYDELFFPSLPTTRPHLEKASHFAIYFLYNK